MTTYTAEDFANAEFARHPDGVVAARFDDGDSMPWRNVNSWLSDADMAADGWVPVREAAAQPITLDALHDAWESAEWANECNEGDILILRRPDSPTERAEVWRSGMTGPITLHTRILHRAPKREPWQSLADVLAVEMPGADDAGRLEALASALYREHGVRVTEGGVMSDMKSTTYTAGDFAEASRARHPNGDLAARFDYLTHRQWRTVNAWLSDDDMARNGWVPVREAADQPITLDTLQDAWENAEQAEWAEPGDVLIWHGSATECYTVRRARSAHTIELNARILHRAPKPKRPEGAETLEALLDEWGDLTRGEEPTPLADWLVERGVRVSEHLSEQSDPSVTMSEGDK